MKQKLLTDIELDVHGLKYLMDLYSKEPTQPLFELLKRNILHMRGCLDEVLQELDSVQHVYSTSFVTEEVEPLIVEESKTSVVDKPTTTIVDEPANPVIDVLEVPLMEEIPVADEDEISVDVEEYESIPLQVQEQEGEFKPSVLGESIKMTAGLRHSISLNDSFRFSRELFGGDADLMNRVVEQMSVMSSYKTAVAFLISKINVTEESEALNDLLELIKKYFNQSA